jgi:hypothetical protein
MDESQLPGEPDLLLRFLFVPPRWEVVQLLGLQALTGVSSCLNYIFQSLTLPLVGLGRSVLFSLVKKSVKKLHQNAAIFF